MAEKDQGKPLAPSGLHPRSDEEKDMSMELKKLHQRKYIKCCGCVTALILIQAVTFLVLVFTVFRVKDPVMRMNGVRFEGTEDQKLAPGTNFSLVADVSVKNPNVASFRFSNTTTIISYDGSMIGEAPIPAGKAKARRTLRMNVTIHIIPERVLALPELIKDASSHIAINISSYTRVAGRVKIMNVIKRNVVVKFNCTMMVNLTSREIQDHNCKRHVLI